ncbi:MAG: tetratricopeptide repeat protein [Alphaproteobacteria bacterium]|nr:tetratricopeptide repeat protein [Alphaproteobacteria bacterium]
MDFYNVKGMFKKAAESGKKAELLLPHINNVTFLSLYYFMRSFQLFTIGNYEEALKHVDISIEKYSTTDFPEHFHIFNKIFKAEILARSGALAKSLELIEANRMNFTKFYPNESNFKVLRMDSVRAFIYLKQGKLKESFDLISSTIDGFNSLFKKDNENAIQGFTHIVLGEIYEKQNDFHHAMQTYKKAEEIYNHIFSEIDGADISYLYKNMAILGEKVRDDFITQKYFQLLLKHFGRDHVRTQEVVDYLEEKSLQVPWSKL